MKNLKIIAVLLITILIVIAAVVSFKITKDRQNSKTEEKSQVEVVSQQPSDLEIQKQLDELNDIQKQQNVQPPTDEQVQTQLKELSDIQQQQNVQPPTDEEVQAQLKELQQLQNK